MEQTPTFEIHVSGYHSSVDEARKVKGASPSELPPLSDEEREVARKLAVPVESYQRMKLAGVYGRKRLEARARALGEQVQSILDGLGAVDKLIAVEWQGSRLRWLLRIQIPDRIVGVPVPVELADDVLDSGILSEIAKLKNLIILGAGHDDQIAKRG